VIVQMRSVLGNPAHVPFRFVRAGDVIFAGESSKATIGKFKIACPANALNQTGIIRTNTKVSLPLFVPEMTQAANHGADGW
jgi:hypothetical protein